MVNPVAGHTVEAYNRKADEVFDETQQSKET